MRSGGRYRMVGQPRSWCRALACAWLFAGMGSALPVSADESADEDDGTLSFPVDRTGEPDGEASVRYTTCPTPLKDDDDATAACAGFVGTATPGIDYTAASGTITFADGEGDPVSLPVSIVDDRIDEDDETFHFVIFAPENLDIPDGDGDSVGTIRDDDPAPVLSIDAPEVSEGDGPLVFALSLDRPSARQLSVPWRTRPDTATAGEDYTHASGTAVFSPGETAAEIEVQITDDDVAEDDETLLLEVDAIPDLKIEGSGRVAGVIEDDDRPEGDPTVNAVGQTVAENSEDGEVEFTVRLSRTSLTAIEVVVVTADGTARSSGTGVAERDYVAIEQQTLVFAAGDRVRTVRVAVNDDDVWEDGPETFTLRLVSAAGAVLGTHGEATISDNEARPQPFFDDRGLLEALAVNEGVGTAAIPVSLSVKSHRAFPVDFSTRATWGATAGVDFVDALPSLTFQPGEHTGRSTGLTVIDDDDVEEDEPLQLFAFESGRSNRETLYVKIIDNDVPPGISVGDSRGDEGSELVFAVKLSGSSVNEITVDWTTADGTAKADEGDYSAANGELRFAPGESRKEVRVTSLQDALDEPAERFRVLLSDPANATLADGVGQGTIGDDDPAVGCRPVVEVAGAVESDDDIEFVVRLEKPSGQRVTFDYATANVTAESGKDYRRKTGTATFQPGETEVRVAVTLIDDEEAESTEQLRLNLSGYVHLMTCSPATLEGVIFDDDTSVHALSIEGGSANESDDTLDFVVTLEPESTDTVTVGYATRNDSAVGGEDFVAATGTVTFTAGQTEQTVAVTLVDDESVEGNEKFKVVLRDPENAHLASGGRSRAVGTIVDDDVAPTVSVAAASGTEGTPGTVTFPVRLSRATAAAVSVRYRMKPGTANAGGDFVSRAGTLSIPAGSDEGELVVALTDNALSERDETFSVEIHSPTNATLSEAVATGTIVDDEAPPSFHRPSAYRHREYTTVQWTLSLTQASANSEYPIELRVHSEDGTAARDDYASFDKRFRMAAGERSIGPENITTVNTDWLDEDDETFTAHFTILDGHVSPDAWSVPVVILDDNEPPSIGVSNPSGQEGATADFRVRLSNPSAREVTVQYATQHGTTTDDDLDAVSGTLVFSPGQESKTVRVSLHADGENEADEETFSLVLSAPTNARLAKPTYHRDEYDAFSWDGTGEGVVLDQDGEPSLSIADAEATEGASGLDFAVTMNRRNHQDVLVDFTVHARTAAQTEDFTSSTYRGRLTFTPGETRKILSVAVVDDDVAELTETLEVQLSSPRYAVITNRPEIALARRIATGTILDDDDIEVSVGEASGEEGGTVAFTVRLTGGVTDAEIVADYALSDGTALSGSDYEPVSGLAADSLWLPPGVTSADIEVELLDDELDEAQETFVLALTRVTGGSARIDPAGGRATGTIEDTDPAPGVSIAGTPVVEEGGTLAFPVSLERPSGQTVTASYATVDDLATAGDDYTAEQGELSFQPGETTLTVEVAVLDDAIAEPDETLALTLTDAANASLDVASATGTILDNDEPSTAIELTADPAQTTEDAGPTPVTVTATLDASARPEATAVTVSVTGGGDDDAVDFEAVDDFEIVIEAGANSGNGTFTLTPEDDAVDETDDTLALTGASDLPVTETSVALADDDPTSTAIVLTADPPLVSENAGVTEVRVTATLDAGARTSATAVTATVDGSGAADAVDYDEVPDFTITIPPGETSGHATITVAPHDDATDERDETLSVTGSSELPVTETSVSLVDDDETSTYSLLAADPASVSEGEEAATVEVTATLDAGARTDEMMVSVTVADSGLADAVDYAPVPDFEITIPAGDTSAAGTFTLEPDDDATAERTESLTLSGTSVLDVQPATVSLVDDDAESTGIDLAASPSRISEAAGPTAVTMTASLNRAARQVATTVTLTPTGSRNADAVDYAPVSNFEITIGAGATSGTGTFTLDPEDDAVDEVNEQISLTGRSELPVTPSTVTLADDDETSTQIALAASPVRVSEGAGPTVLTVAAALNRAARTTVTPVSVRLTGSGDAGAVDYAALPDFTVRIPAGRTSGRATVTLTPEDDGLEERNETLRVSGRADLPVTGTTVALLDDDAGAVPPALSASDATATEDAGALPFVVTLDLAQAAEVSVRYLTSGVSATAGADYTETSGTLTFGPGEVSATVRVEVLDDDTPEPDETVTLILSAPYNATLERATGLGTILDDDAPPMTTFRVLLFESAANPARQGFLRVINHSPESGYVRIDAVDDGGVGREPITLGIEAGQARHFNSDDLEYGNPEKGLSGGVGPPSQGEWRLKLSSDLDVEVLAYARTPDGFVTTMHDAAPVQDGEHRVSFFNPGHNLGQTSLLRLVNTGTGDVEAAIAGSDDAGVASGEVRVEIPARTVLTLSAAELESGDAAGILNGALGTGSGKWRLTVASPLPLAVKGLLTSPPGYLANLSTSPRTPGSAADTHGVLLFPSMSEPGRAGVIRVINHSAEPGEVRIVAQDDTATEYDPLTLAVAARGAAHFNSEDLELGNANKGLTGSTGTGVGPWRLDLSSAQDIEVLSYVRSYDGFLTPVHDLTPVADDVHRVAFFNPASNWRMVSRLRLVNVGGADASVTVTGVDDAGEAPGSAVRLRVPAATALEVTSAALESGQGAGIDSGALGDGVGKWRLRVTSDPPIQVMSLLDSPTGHVTNMSTTLNGAKGSNRPAHPSDGTTSE